MEAMDPVSLMFVLEVILTMLKGFEMVSRTDMPFQSSSLLGSLTCLGVTEISLVMKLY